MLGHIISGKGTLYQVISSKDMLGQVRSGKVTLTCYVRLIHLRS
jgi:hypothetical protein